MAWVWNGWGLLHLAAGASSFAMAALVLSQARGRAQNRALALFLATWGASMTARGLGFSMSEPEDAFGWYSAQFLSWPLSALAMLGFLGTLPTSLARPLGTRPARWALVLAVLAIVASWPLGLREFALIGVYQGAFYTVWNSGAARGFSAFLAFDLLSLLTGLFGLAVAFDLYRRSPAGTETRRRAKAYLLAFGVSDAVSVSIFAIIFWLWSGGSWSRWGPIFLKPEAANAGEAIIRWSIAGGLAVQAIIFVALLGYAILRSQLFAIDLKIKWTLSKGTVAAAFVGVFFVVSEGAATLFSDRIGPVAGLFAAGALVFAIAPLQRVADRFADKAMPSVTDDAEYRTVRKREVYRAAVESALEEGDISPKERGMLATLAEQLGVGPKEMHDIEREARAARGGAA